ncbi:MAG: HpcH/HpaI aldolase/citrate lyase family protein, partial [Culicoidibacterales bacterium]
NVLTLEQLAQITGFVFPKFTATNGVIYLKALQTVSEQLGKIVYAMPILESRELIFKETRTQNLIAISQLLKQYRHYILNLRLGGTDFSAAYGLRRPMTMSIYQLTVVAECFTEIINFFARESEGYVISGPVWEYFSFDPTSQEVQGLLNELALDQANGLFGKTAIHPVQVDYINYASVVTYEAYTDAHKIVSAQQLTGVFKGEGANKMNEIAPHRNWAKNIMMRAHIYGVLKPGYQPADLLIKE